MNRNEAATEAKEVSEDGGFRVMHVEEIDAIRTEQILTWDREPDADNLQIDLHIFKFPDEEITPPPLEPISLILTGEQALKLKWGLDRLIGWLRSGRSG